MSLKFEFLSLFVDIMPSQRGRSRPCSVPVDEEDASAPPSQGDPPIPPKFSVLFVPQAEIFPPMTSEAFQAFTTYWCAQAQAQAEQG